MVEDKSWHFLLRRSRMANSMKKLLLLVVTIFVILTTAWADDLDNQIQLKETQLQSLQWEFRYLQERVTTLQSQGQKLQTEIDALKKQKAESIKEKEKK